jgi:16S rRNA (guanine1207-N2)-methyltransferase
VTRPGTFSYGKFDNGARALMELAVIEPGDRVLDLGCGCGTNGVFAWQRCGPDGHVTFVDSNVRALALAETNARANGVTGFDLVATPRVEGLPDAGYDVLLVNPPYFAQSSIARLFVERGRQLLKPGGRFYLVTRQPNETATLMADVFGDVEAYENRGYVILTA